MTSTEYKIQTGIWDAPQIVSFDSLFDQYTVDNVFNSSIKDKMVPILKKWKDNAQNHLEIVKKNRYVASPSLVTYVPDCPHSLSDSRRSKFVTFKQNPHIIHKIYNMAPGKGNHLAHTLRAPMAKLVEATISDKNLTFFGVPKEGLFPIATKEIISTLDEQDINHAFIVCTEKKEVLDVAITVEKIKEMNPELQKKIAEQACQIPLSTGLGDYTWANIQKDAHRDIFYVLDTEPLYGELLIDIFEEGNYIEKGYLRNTIFARNFTLKSSAKLGLSEFKKSSENYDLEIIANAAQGHLEKFD
jgi:hypothetical protein